MTKEYKDLLLKDLCARLPYNVFVNTIDIKCVLQPHDISDLIKCDVDVKPYLFPMSSMTEEQRYEISSGLQNIHTEHPPFGKIENSGSDNCLECVIMASTWLIEYYNKNHLDYRGLIPIDLAIDCTNLNIYQS